MYEHNETDRVVTPFLNLEIKMTEEEVYTCLQKTSHRSKKLVWFQTIVLLLIFINCLFSFIIDDKKEFSSLGIGAAALIILAIVWVVPFLHNRHVAKTQVKEQEGPVQIKLYEDRLVFGNEEKKSFLYSECEPVFCENILVLSFGYQIVGIPRRLVDEEMWKRVLQKFHEN